MSAAARGAAGYRYIHFRKKKPVRTIVAQPGDVAALAQHLQTRFNVSPARAAELAAEQAAKTFNRAPRR